MNMPLATHHKAMNGTGNRLIDKLLGNGIIDMNQAKAAKKHAQQKTNETAEDYLLNHRIVSTHNLAETIANIRQVAFSNGKILNSKMLAKQWAEANGGVQSFTQHKIIPVTIKGHTVMIAAVNHLRAFDEAKDFISRLEARLNTTLKTFVCDPLAVCDLFDDFAFGSTTQTHRAQSFEQSVNQTLESDSDEKAQDLFNLIIKHAVKKQASDIHIEPGSKDYGIRFRINGDLENVASLPLDIGEMLGRHIASKSREEILPGKELKAKVAYKFKHGSTEVIREFRISSYGTFKKGVINDDLQEDAPLDINCVIRVLNNAMSIPTLPELGYSREQEEQLKILAMSPKGIILLTGETGSGKTTTLATMMDMRRGPNIKICTAEDPVEYDIPLVTQFEIDNKRTTFSSAIKQFLRMDPDVIMVGEIRDEEVLESAIHAAESGHPLYSTLHSASAVATFDRIDLLKGNLRMFLDICSGIVSQRLVRVNCPSCSKEVTIGNFLNSRQKDVSLYGHIEDWFTDDQKIRMAVPNQRCNLCGGSGLGGRTSIAEVLLMDNNIREFVAQNRQQSSIQEFAIQNGFKTMHHIAKEKVLAGELDPGLIVKKIDKWPHKKERRKKDEMLNNENA